MINVEARAHGRAAIAANQAFLLRTLPWAAVRTPAGAGTSNFRPLLGRAQRVEDYLPPVWPSGPVPKQLHLELAVDDLDAAEATALALSVRKAEEQPAPNR